MRYVIDFYFDESHAGSTDAFAVDARPALDSLGSVADRAKMGVRVWRRSVCTSRRTDAANAQVYVWCLRLGLPCPFSKAPTLLPAAARPLA